MDLNIASYVEWLLKILKVVFSWIILMSISVIISGKLLNKLIRFDAGSDQLFKIPLKVLVIEAKGGEVILGFTGFIMTLCFVGVGYGQKVYLIVKNNFGIDPGQFYSVCMLSSFLAVFFSFVLFITHYLIGKLGKSFIENKEKYEDLIQKLSNKK